MIREIGRWKQIEWDEDAARRVFDYCGGHPLFTRCFASHACEEGARKAIDYPRVEETAKEIQGALRRNEIGNYYSETHLSLFKREEVIASWHDRRIIAGQAWKGQIDSHLDEADIILLLISADFLASDYCYAIEMPRALARHEAGHACVIPVIIRSVDWSSAPFAALQALPKDAKPVTRWGDPDEAWTDVARGLRRAAEERRNRLLPS